MIATITQLTQPSSHLCVCVFLCGKNIKIYSVSEFSSTSCSIVNYSHPTVHQIFRIYSSCISETLCTLTNIISFYSWCVESFYYESESASHSVMSDSLQPHGLQPARLLCQQDSPGKNTAVGCHSLLQGVFPTQGSNPSLLHCRFFTV